VGGAGCGEVLSNQHNRGERWGEKREGRGGGRKKSKRGGNRCATPGDQASLSGRGSADLRNQMKEPRIEEAEEEVEVERREG